MPLSMAKPGESGLIKQINGKDETKTFLANLGFTEGSEVKVISEISGNLIVSVKESRVAVGKSMAGRIMI